MSNHQTDQLTQALRERSDAMAGTHLGLDAVKGRARGIQRRRRTAVVTVAAAVVLAIGIPVGLNLGDVTNSQEPLPANPSPAPSPGPVEPPAPTGPVEVDATELRPGSGPAIAWLIGPTLMLPGQDQIDLGRAYTQVTPYLEGWLATGSGKTFVLDADGTVLESFPGQGLAVSTDGSRVVTQLDATGGTDLQLRTAPFTELPLSATVEIGPSVRLLGFTGPEEAAYVSTVPTGGGSEERVLVTDFLREPRRLEGLIGARGASEVAGLVSGQTSYNADGDGGSCWAVVDVATGDRRWETCTWIPERYSPEGRYVVAESVFSDGIGGSALAILDAATGEEVAEFSTEGLGQIVNPLWESDGTVLAETYQDGAWYAVRLGVDGSVERALGPELTGDDIASPWGFAATP
ncbi:MAG: hypothetical protein WBQ50_10285 [Nocardioides sp.]